MAANPYDWGIVLNMIKLVIGCVLFGYAWYLCLTPDHSDGGDVTLRDAFYKDNDDL